MNRHTTEIEGSGEADASAVHFDITHFVNEHELYSLLNDGRPRSRRAKAAVLKRFADRHGLTIYRLGQTRLYRRTEWYRAFMTESDRRVDAILKGIKIGRRRRC